MTQCINLWIDRDNYRKTKIVEYILPELAEGEILVAIDKFGLTANNVTYAVSGDLLGYWDYFPTRDKNWGSVPAWGCASVIESKCDDIPTCERLWGFFPMSSHTILTPGQIKKNQFSDISDHRVHLPSLYNGYRRTNADPELLQKMEDERCSLFPAFVTSFVLYDYLVDNNFFGAEQLLIGSVSSKTGFGLAHMLRSDENISAKIVGLTSSGHTDFVNTLNCCDDVVEYGKETDIDTSLTTTYVDMSGDVALKTSLHNHLQDNLVGSCVVGVSHWENRGDAGDLPGAKPAFFFVPGHIAKRDEEWGPGVTVMRAMQASTKVATHVKNHINLEWVKGSDDLINVWGRLLDNKVPPSRGLLASLL